ncbi:MAG: hypothetical protein H7328_09760 [Bdellovibrio sp.]|nr:hypothetical protein [Bdellovibrio sp.]
MIKIASSAIQAFVLLNLGSQPVFSQQEEEKAPEIIYAMKGLSVGLSAMTQSYSVRGDIYDVRTPALVATARFADESQVYKNIGITIRYSDLPVNQLGADINLSYYGSVNHAEIYSAPTLFTGRIEFNGAYTHPLNQGMKMYFFAGWGVQHVQGATSNRAKPAVNDYIKPWGFGLQGGIGMKISSLNYDITYSYYRHSLGDDYNKAFMDNNPNLAVRTERAIVETKGLSARVTHKF